MAIMAPTISITVHCSSCNYKGTKTMRRDERKPLNDTAIDFCPKCGWFTLKDTQSILSIESIKNAFNKD